MYSVCHIIHGVAWPISATQIYIFSRDIFSVHRYIFSTHNYIFSTQIYFPDPDEARPRENPARSTSTWRAQLQGSECEFSRFFCPSCGQKKDNIEVNPCVSTKSEPTTSSSVSSTVHLQMPQMCLLAQQAMVNGLCHSIITDMTKKAEERASYLRPSKTQRVSEKQVAINIGVTELNKDGVANILRGKTGPLPLKISKEADILSVLAVHRPFYISSCISTLPTQHTTFMTIQNPP